MTISKEVLSLSDLLKNEMVLSEDKTMITINEKGIVEALSNQGLELDVVNKVHDVTKNIFNASLHAAGQIIEDQVFNDDSLPEQHTTVFHMNQFQNDNFTHSFNRTPEGIEVYSVYDQVLEGNDYKAISNDLRERFKVVL